MSAQPLKPPPLHGINFVNGANFDDLNPVEKDYLKTLHGLFDVLKKINLCSKVVIVVGKADPEKEENGKEPRTIFALTTLLNPILAQFDAKITQSKAPDKDGWSYLKFEVRAREIKLPRL